MTKTVLILGANGNIGGQCAKAFAADGWNVRRYDRAEDMSKAAMGVDVIVNGLNPPNYNNWAKNIPPITRAVIAAAKASGATVIVPGNVYVFGDQPGVWDENTPHHPNSRKGQIRKELEASYRAAALEGVQCITLRAGDFIDPDSDATVMKMVMFKGLKNGKLTLLGRGDAQHAWCFTPDFARAAVALANRRGELAMYEDIPFPGQTMTGNEIKAMLEPMLGRSLKIKGFPWWLMRLAIPVWELARELREMRYLWDVDHQLSGEKLARLLPDFVLTPNRLALAGALGDDVHPNKAVVRADVTI